MYAYTHILDIHIYNCVSTQLNIIKTSLCLEGSVNYSCLDIFPVIANSAALYQFIQEKQFTGEKGQALFQQQYQLITAQLQHDDNVLKQLSATFFFMASFMDKEQNFQSLMSQVTKLNTSHRLKQLDTVNENITLVRSWFSRAEVRIVASGLLKILSVLLCLILFPTSHSHPCLLHLFGILHFVTCAPSKLIIHNNVSAMNNIHRFNESCLLIAMYMNNNVQVTPPPCSFEFVPKDVLTGSASYSTDSQLVLFM